MRELFLREYNNDDAKIILSFTNDKESFYLWSAGVLGVYPLSSYDFNKRIEELKINRFYPYVLTDGLNCLGFISLRYRDNSNNLTLGFVIINPNIRGKGIGKKMLELAINKAFDEFKVSGVNLRVFVNNTPAYNCYKACGLEENGIEEIYEIDDIKLKCIELAKKN